MSQKRLDSTLQQIKYKNPDKLPADFYQTLNESLNQTSIIIPLHEKYRKTVLTIAALLLFGLGIVLGQQFGSTDNTPVHITAVTVKQNEPVTIYLVYDSDKAQKDVAFRIVLDSALHFVSEDIDIQAQKEIAWTGDLDAGKNEIPVVVAGNSIGEWHFVAQARIDGVVTENRVKIKVNG